MASKKTHHPLTAETIRTLSENIDLECKKAAGRDGKGRFPKSALESYSAMANTDGGRILLGVEEKPKGVFNPIGIKNVENVLKEIWDAF